MELEAITRWAVIGCTMTGDAVCPAAVLPPACQALTYLACRQCYVKYQLGLSFISSLVYRWGQPDKRGLYYLYQIHQCVQWCRPVGRPGSLLTKLRVGNMVGCIH